MMSQNNKGELKKMSKKMFAPPVARPDDAPPAKGKSHALLDNQEDTDENGISAFLSHDGGATKPIKAAKILKKRQKGGTSSKKGLGTTKENEGCLSDTQFEEIFQSVLRRPLQEHIENSGKKAFSADPTKEEGLGRETLEVSLTSKNGISRNKNEATPSEVKKKVQQSGMKKNSKLTESKNRKGKNEKPEADNGGCKENRKGAPKKKVQGNARVVIDQEEMQEEEEEEKADGGSGSSWCIAWVQCSYPNCEKWRRLSSEIDPSALPEDWSCSQNPDLQHNSCSIPEETWSGSENEVVYAVYIPGSLVWARQYGYPWWPGIIEADPDIGEYFLFSSQADSLPSKYHMTFFGNSVTRAWISASMLRSFVGSNVEGNGLAKLRSKGDKRSLETALKMAKAAEQINIQERIRKFGFHSRFRERASCKDLQDSVNVTCKPCAKKVRGPGGEKKKKDPETPNESHEKHLLDRPVMKPDVNVKKKIQSKEDKKVNLATEDLPPLSKKGRREGPSLKAEAVAEGSGRREKNDQKGCRKSFSVPLHKNNKAKHLSSCIDSSTPHLALCSYLSKKDSLDKAKISPMAESKDTEDPKEPSQSVAFDQDGEEIFSSQEVAVFAVEKNDSLEDFSLVLDEE